jgi:hypothetical protein
MLRFSAGFAVPVVLPRRIVGFWDQPATGRGRAR